MVSATQYDADFFEWSQQQAYRLRSNDFSDLDCEHLAEEIEGLGASQRNELRSRLTLVLHHLLKWQFQPERRGPSWTATIREQRASIGFVLAESPSLRRQVEGIMEQSWKLARLRAMSETGLQTLPKDCPYSAEVALRDDFFPD